MNQRELDIATQWAHSFEDFLNASPEDLEYEWQRVWGQDPQEPADIEESDLIALQEALKRALTPLLTATQVDDSSMKPFREAVKTITEEGLQKMAPYLELQYAHSSEDGNPTFIEEPYAAPKETLIWYRLSQVLRAKRLGKCLYCGRYFYKTRTDARFCRDSHRRMYHTRELRKKEKTDTK